MDGTVNPSSSGTGVIIINLDKGMKIQCAFKFEFEATNNEVEYEAIIISLELALNLEF